MQNVEYLCGVEPYRLGLGLVVGLHSTTIFQSTFFIILYPVFCTLSHFDESVLYLPNLIYNFAI